MGATNPRPGASPDALEVELQALERLVDRNDHAIREVITERDRRYAERFDASDRAVMAALAAQEKQTTAAFLASEKAIVKAEDAQRAYNASHNDLVRKQEAMIPRPEFDARLANLDQKIEEQKKEVAGLRESRSAGGGREASTDKLVAYAFGGLGLVIGLGTLIVHLLKL